MMCDVLSTAILVENLLNVVLALLPDLLNFTYNYYHHHCSYYHDHHHHNHVMFTVTVAILS
jgi:hypothetical protein